MPATRATLSLLLACLLVALAHPAAGESSDYLMDLWTGDNGLPDSSVSAVTQTPDGYLWIGTQNGLARFDGMRFVYFDPLNTPALKHARIHSLGLFTDYKGRLWINTYDGSMTSYADGSFKHEWQGGQVSAVFSQSNRVYFALLRGGLVCRDESVPNHTNWQNIPLPGVTSGVNFRQDATRQIWFMTRDGSLGRVIGTSCESVDLKEHGLNGSRVRFLNTDRHGQLWIISDREVARWNGRQFDDLTPTNAPPAFEASFISGSNGTNYWLLNNGVVQSAAHRRWTGEVPAWNDLSLGNLSFSSTYADQRGNTWIRSFGQGFFYTDDTGKARRLTAENGLPNDRVNCWFEDDEGNIWIGVERGGLLRLREKKFQIIGTNRGIPIPTVSSVCETPDHSIWFGTFGGGLYRLSENTLANFSLEDGTRTKFFFSLAPAADGQLWMSAGNEDLYVLTNETIRAHKGDHGIKVLLADQAGGIWSGRTTGLSRLVGTNFFNFNSRGEIERFSVRALAEDKSGRIWIGTENGQLLKYERGTFSTFQSDDSLKDQAIWSLLPDEDGSVWIGTFRGGLLRFKDGRFTRYTSRDGLPNDIICQILDDNQGRLWIGTHKGLFNVTKKSLRDFHPEHREQIACNPYGLSDGLPTLEFTGGYQPACWKAHDGSLWFASVKGLVSVNPAKVATDPIPPRLLIEEVAVDGRPTTNLASAKPVTIVIPPGKRRLDIRYTAINFGSPDKIQFRYRLSGFEEEWIDAGSERVAHYGPLAPGKYHFQVIAGNRDGVWNTTGAGLNIIQTPFVWQTWWCKLLGAGLLLAAIITSVRYIATYRLRRKIEQLKQQHAIERERERIAKDIHDDLGAGLTHIMFQSSLAKNATPERMQTDLSQISETARDLVRTMDEIVWAIDPENDTLDSLVTYLGKYVQDYLTAARLRCRLDLPAELPPIAVPAELRHNIYLATKEVLNNTVKHAHATEVHFKFELATTSYKFIFQDNGSGIPSASQAEPSHDSLRNSSGHGLKGLNQRLSGLGGECRISSSPDHGTRVELVIPMKKLF